MRPSDTARRRRETLDKTLSVALTVLILLYVGVTLLTYYHVSVLSDRESSSSLNPRGRIANRAVDALLIDELQHTFPIHVGKDVEVIPHPGLSIATDKRKIPRDLRNAKLTVPRFFEDSHGAVYGGSIREYLGGGNVLMTPEQAKSIGSFWKDSSGPEQGKDSSGVESAPEQGKSIGSFWRDSSRVEHETIYCSVASYRDPECTATVEDIYQRAAYPERIRVAILDQRIDGDPVCSRPATECDKDPEQALCKYRHLIDVFEMDARMGVGPVFARHLAHRHYRGEYFAMQVDSHVRFTKDWDEDIIGQWKSAKNEMAVLTTYLSDLIGSIDPVTHESKHHSRPIMCVSDYEGNGAYKHLRHGQQPEGPAGIHGEPTLHPFWAAGFAFARGHFVIQVPYDQYLPMVFQGEEISMGLRGFTYGYDYYTPERSVCFHMYAVKENKAKRKKIPLFWENSASYKGVGTRAMKRLNSIIGMGKFPESEWSQEEMDKYGLGKIRTTEKFFKTFGIHTESQTVEHHLCRFVGKPMMKKFLPALRSNGMGLDYDKIDYEFVDPAPEQKKKKKY